MPAGLTTEEAERRVAALRDRRLRPRQAGLGALLLRQLESPLLVLLVAAAILSAFVGEDVSAGLIAAILALSTALGVQQEHKASRAVAALLARVAARARVVRDGVDREVPLTEVVPGDLVRLSAGDAVPGDGALVEAEDLFITEATLTGESFPVAKRAGADGREGRASLGTHVASGAGLLVVEKIGRDTELGAIADRLRLRPPETDFERGVRHFGQLLVEVTLLLVLAIFAVNVALHRPVITSLLFSLALAVGLTPQLLPAIISVNLAHGAARMAERRVIVKRLAAIEDFGSMDVLCSDKTGTLTEGAVRLVAALGADGTESAEVLEHAHLNAALQTGFRNPIDAAILDRFSGELPPSVRKLGERPYDFVRKRLSVIVDAGAGPLLVTKGAFDNVVAVCATVRLAGAVVPLAPDRRAALDEIEERAAREGQRVLAVAVRAGADAVEEGMTFLGLLLFSDPLKPTARAAVATLAGLGIRLKVLSGDSRFSVAARARQIGLPDEPLLTGPALREMTDEALLRAAAATDLYAEVEPNQKARIVGALRRAGHVVGFMGDGVNDAAALHAADVSISVDDAVDVAKDAADLVLLEKDLGVLEGGVRAGRVAFANTMKYVFMATSANFGNMFSMAGASLILPFLPLLPFQVLLVNLLTDLPEMTIAADRVDPEMVERPRRWDLHALRRFMLGFGLLSSVFDYATFAALAWGLHAAAPEFRAGWFVESVASATLVVLVIRTRRPFYKSRPGRLLALASAAAVAVAALLPWSPAAGLLELGRPPGLFVGVLVGILVAYMAAAEGLKRFFFPRGESG